MEKIIHPEVFIRRLVDILRAYFGQTKTYYKNYLHWYTKRYMSEDNFLFDILNLVTIFDYDNDEADLSFNSCKTCILAILEEANSSLSFEFSQEEQNQIATFIGWIIFLQYHEPREITSADIFNLQDLLNNSTNIFSVYFGAQITSIINGLSSYSDIYSLTFNADSDNQKIIDNYYRNRYLYGEKYVEDTSEIIS